jgi:hypothetical protein
MSSSIPKTGRRRSFLEKFAGYFVKFIFFYGVITVMNFGLRIGGESIIILTSHGKAEGEIIGTTNHLVCGNKHCDQRDYVAIKFKDERGDTYLTYNDFRSGEIKSPKVEVNYFKLNPSITIIGNVKTAAAVGFTMGLVGLILFTYALSGMKYKR